MQSDALYPVFLRLAGRRALVVGGGRVALRRVRELLRGGARVSVLSPAIHPDLASLPGVRLRRHAYRAGSLSGAELVFVAVDEAEVARRIVRDCRERGVWVNAADRPEECDFFLPAVVRQGGVQVAISTGGRCPALAVALARHVGGLLPKRLGRFADVLARLRRELRDRLSPPARRRVLRELAGIGSLRRFAREGAGGWLRWARRLAGER